ncbi:MAG: DUF3108 domain-containing protein [Thermaceae bacterium]
MRPGVYVYHLAYGGSPAGEAVLEVVERGRGVRLSLTSEVWLPPPRVRQRWQSDLDEHGFPLFYAERKEERVFRVEFLREEGQVVLTQGGESLGLPYVVDYHDPLSLLYALSRLDLEVGQVARFHLVGGRAYAKRLPDQEGFRVYRLRPGVSYLYFQEGLPVRMVQEAEGHVFEARLERVEPPRTALKRGRRWV